MRDYEEILETIQRQSKAGYSNKISIVEKLLKDEWCSVDDLAVAYGDLQPPDDNRVMLFFQIPFQVQLEDCWVKVSSEFGHPYLRFRPMPSGKKTQVLVSFQLWERRRQLYALYLDGIEGGQKSVKTDLKASGSLVLGEFELDVAKRLRLQAVHLLKDFIPIYKLASGHYDAYPPDLLEHVFIMVKTGRLVPYRSDLENAEHKDSGRTQPDFGKNLNALKRLLKVNRPPSVYETYLVETRRLVGLKQYNLAVVQSVMILDWFANEMLESHLLTDLKKSLSHNNKLFRIALDQVWENPKNQTIRIGTEQKFVDYFPAIGIDLGSELVGQLRKLIKLRNEIVHRSQANLADEIVAIRAIDTASGIVSQSLESLIRKFENRKAIEQAI